MTMTLKVLNLYRVQNDLPNLLTQPTPKMKTHTESL